MMRGNRLGSWTVLDTLGQGGMGLVVRACHDDGTLAAIKVIRGHDPEFEERFRREQRLLVRLGDQGGFVRLLDHGESPLGPWVAMELIEGGTLADRVRERPLGIDEGVALLTEVVRIMSRAHVLGVVHRDLKPGNILLADDGPRVADLGLAKHLFRREGYDSLSITGRGDILGTLGYMAPEQLRNTREAGPAADVWSLGVMLYETVSGRRPFYAGSPIDFLRVMEGQAPAPLRSITPECPVWLEELVADCLVPDPKLRLGDADELLAELERHGGRGSLPNHTPSRSDSWPTDSGSAGTRSLVETVSVPARVVLGVACLVLLVALVMQLVPEPLTDPKTVLGETGGLTASPGAEPAADGSSATVKADPGTPSDKPVAGEGSTAGSTKAPGAGRDPAVTDPSGPPASLQSLFEAIPRLSFESLVREAGPGRHPGFSTDVVWLDGDRVLTACLEGSLHVWDAATCRERRRCELGLPIVDLERCADGRVLVGSNDRGELLRLDRQLAVTERIPIDVSPGRNPVFARSLEPGLALAGSRSGAQLIELATRRSVARPGEGELGWILALAIAPGGKRAAIVGHRGGVRGPLELRLVRLPDGAALARAELEGSTCDALEFSPDGRRLLVALSAGRGVVHELGAGREPTLRAALSFVAEPGIAQRAPELRSPLRIACWLPDGDILTGTGDGCIRRGRIRGNQLEPVQTLLRLQNVPRRLALSPDGERMAVVDFGGSLHIAPVRRATEAAPGELYPSGVERMKTTRDGRLMIIMPLSGVLLTTTAGREGGGETGGETGRVFDQVRIDGVSINDVCELNSGRLLFACSTKTRSGRFLITDARGDHGEELSLGDDLPSPMRVAGFPDVEGFAFGDVAGFVSTVVLPDRVQLLGGIPGSKGRPPPVYLLAAARPGTLLAVSAMGSSILGRWMSRQPIGGAPPRGWLDQARALPDGRRWVGQRLKLESMRDSSLPVPTGASVELYDGASPRVTRLTDSSRPFRTFALSPEGRTLVVASADGADLRVIDVTERSVVVSGGALLDGDRLSRMAFLPDGRLAILTVRGTLVLARLAPS